MFSAWHYKKSRVSYNLCLGRVGSRLERLRGTRVCVWTRARNHANFPNDFRDISYTSLLAEFFVYVSSFKVMCICILYSTIEPHFRATCRWVSMFHTIVANSFVSKSSLNFIRDSYCEKTVKIHSSLLTFRLPWLFWFPYRATRKWNWTTYAIFSNNKLIGSSLCIGEDSPFVLIALWIKVAFQRISDIM